MKKCGAKVKSASDIVVHGIPPLYMNNNAGQVIVTLTRKMFTVSVALCYHHSPDALVQLLLALPYSYGFSLFSIIMQTNSS